MEDKIAIEEWNVYKLDHPQTSWINLEPNCFYIKVIDILWPHFVRIGYINYHLHGYENNNVITIEYMNEILLGAKYVWKLRPRYKRLFSKEIWLDE